MLISGTARPADTGITECHTWLSWESCNGNQFKKPNSAWIYKQGYKAEPFFHSLLLKQSLGLLSLRPRRGFSLFSFYSAAFGGIWAERIRARAKTKHRETLTIGFTFWGIWCPKMQHKTLVVLMQKTSAQETTLKISCWSLKGPNKHLPIKKK